MTDADPILAEENAKQESRWIIGEALHWSGPMGAAFWSKLNFQSYKQFMADLTSEEYRLLARIFDDYFRAPIERGPYTYSTLQTLYRDLHLLRA